MSFHGAVSIGVNRPKFDELSPFEQEEANRFKIGNPNLEPARSWNFNLGTDYVQKNMAFGINLSYKNVSGVIEEVDTGIDKNGKDVLQFENVGDGWIKGIELEQRGVSLGITNISFLRRFTLCANETFLDSELEEEDGDKRPFKDQPSFISNLGFDYLYEPFGTVFTASWNYIGEREKSYTEYSFNTFSPAFAIRAENGYF